MTTAPVGCVKCGGTLKPDAAFCGQCGRSRHAPIVTAGGGLRLAIGYYLALLAIQAVALVYAQITEEVFGTIVVATVASALVTIAIAVPHRALVVPALIDAGFGPRGYVVLLLLAPVVLVIVLGYVHGLASLFGIQVPSDLDGFDDRGMLWAIVLTVIAPPLEEELGFRGLMYGALRDKLTVAETFLISSFAFALLHLSVPALLTHVPLGLYLCWLRHRSGSLWPPIFAHACHNAGVIIAEWSGWS